MRGEKLVDDCLAAIIALQIDVQALPEFTRRLGKNVLKHKRVMCLLSVAVSVGVMITDLNFACQDCLALLIAPQHRFHDDT